MSTLLADPRRSPGRLSAALALLLLVVLLPGRAAAERIALASFRLTGEALQGPARTTLRSSLLGGLVAAGFDVVPEVEVARALERAPGLAGCETSPCLRRLAELLEVRRVVRAHVEVIGTSNFAISAELVDPGGGPTATANESCQVCTLSEANEAASRAAASLRPQAAAPIAPPTSAPASAPPAPVTPPARRARWFVIGAAIAGVLGLGAIAAGAGLTAIHGAERTRYLENGQLVIEKWNTLGAGVPLLVGGALLGVTAGVLGWRAAVARRAASLSLAPRVGPGEAGLVLAGSF